MFLEVPVTGMSDQTALSPGNVVASDIPSHRYVEPASPQSWECHRLRRSQPWECRRLRHSQGFQSQECRSLRRSQSQECRSLRRSQPWECHSLRHSHVRIVIDCNVSTMVRAIFSCTIWPTRPIFCPIFFPSNDTVVSSNYIYRFSRAKGPISGQRNWAEWSSS